ncbi:MAG: ABC transporter substrate-binding protein [Reyranella sp.]|nr:ABC transporter substrate-binding protein [Reyranella sp.]MDP3161216.1 ABC transporter substrate-binding protein [Reyranella sp.]
MRFTLARAALSGIGVMLVAAFGQPAAAQTEITVQYPMPQIFKDALVRIADDFTKLHPDVKVRFLIPGDTYGDLLQKSLRAALTKTLPDVTLQALPYLRTFVDRDSAVDLGPLIAADPAFRTRGDDPTFLKIGTMYGKQYGLPFAISAPLIFYNADLVRKAGGDPDKMPTSWDGIMALAGKIALLPDTDSGFHMSMDSAPDWYWQMMVNSFGGEMVDEKTMKVAFNGPAGRKAMATVQQMRDVGKMKPMSVSAARQSFFAGRMGMSVSSSSTIGQADRNIGERFKWGILPIPMTGDKARMSAGGNLAIIHTTNPAKQKAAWEFIKFATGPIGTTYQVKMVGYMPTNTKAISDPALLGKFYQEHPLFAESAKLMPYLTGWYAYPGDNGLKIIDAIKRALAGLYEGRTNADAAMTEMSDGVQALLPK